jgi:hypothetical protein
LRGRARNHEDEEISEGEFAQGFKDLEPIVLKLVLLVLKA